METDKVKREQHCGAGSEVTKPEECTVCYLEFEETERRPRTLPCGHTFCSPCVQKLINRSQLSCPTCCAQHPALGADDFPISYLMEALMKNLRVTVLAQTSPPAMTTARAVSDKAGAERPHRKPEAISKRLQALLQEEKENCSSVLGECREAQSRLEQYHTRLAGWNEQHKHLEGSLLHLAHRSRECRELIGQEASRVLALTEEGRQEEQEVEAMQGHLDTPATAGEADMALDSSHNCTSQAKNWTQKCWELFPSAELVTSSLKVLEATEAAVAAAEKAEMKEGAESSATAVPPTLGDPATTIQQRLESLITPPPGAAKKSPAVEGPPIVKAQDIQDMKESTRKLVEAGRVVAVLQDGGRCRSSKITVQGQHVYLHPLQDQPPPSRAATLQMSEVVPAAPPCRVFLDLAWPGSPPQRVHIRLSPDTPLGRQFLLLCTGLRGPCYQGSRLLGVCGGGEQGEGVAGGDYQRNDGGGGAALLPDLYRGEYWDTDQPGAVWGRICLHGSKASQFGITTRENEDDGLFGFIFGWVEHGLPAVRAVASHSPITEVTVVDCGVLLSS